MPSLHREFMSRTLLKARSVNQTSASFVAKIPTGTEPSGDAGTATGSAIIEIGKSLYRSAAGIRIIPFGVGNDDTTFSVRVIGWAKSGPDATALWVPTTIAELDCTLSTAVGVAAKYVIDTERFADTITLAFGNDDVTAELSSPANNTIAIAQISLKDYDKAELSFETGSSATSCNALYSVY